MRLVDDHGLKSPSKARILPQLCKALRLRHPRGDVDHLRVRARRSPERSRSQVILVNHDRLDLFRFSFLYLKSIGQTADKPPFVLHTWPVPNAFNGLMVTTAFLLPPSTPHG